MKISVITIAYGGYGRFIPQFIKCLEEQEVKPDEVVIVISEDHKAKIPESEIGFKIVYAPKRASMGKLRNKAKDETHSEWTFYCDIDDYILPNAIKEIKETIEEDTDAVALKYIGSQDRILRTYIPEIKENGDRYFKKFVNGLSKFGYIAVKKELAECEDTDYPNFPQIFWMAVLKAKFKETRNVCVKYNMWQGSHATRKEEFKKNKPAEIIEGYAKQYYQRYISGKV